MLAYGVHDLQEAGILPGLNNLAFDVSDADPAESSWYGTLLKGTLNFSPATTWLEAVAWVAYLVPTMTRLPAAHPHTRADPAPTAPAASAGARLTEPERPDPVNRLLTAACAAALLAPLVGVQPDRVQRAGRQGRAAAPINVDSSADACDARPPTKAPSGNVVFKVKNTGNEVTEFYLYGEDGMRIVGEIENIGPGLSRDLVVRAAPGKYVTACKPGMNGEGIRDDVHRHRLRQGHRDQGRRPGRPSTPATTQYAAYVKDQVAAARRPDHRVRRRLQGRRGRQGPGAVPARPRPLGAHRDRRRVLR